MQRRVSTGLAGLIAALAVIVTVTGLFNLNTRHKRVLYAQLSCEDPFGNTLLHFNPEYWDTDFCKRDVSLLEIVAGGPGPNGIPPIYEPEFETASSAAQWLNDRSPVIALSINGETRAYPLAIMMWHEIVNDAVGGVPVAVTYCPLCNSAIVYDRRVEGQVLAFGTTGNLRGSNLIMWDHLTQSWWQEFTGEAIVGEFTGERLEVLPSQVVGFGDFLEQFPDSQVLQIPDYNRDYGSNAYPFYDSEGQPALSTMELEALDDRLDLTDHVLGGTVGGVPVAYPLGTLAREKAINDTVGGEDIVAVWQPGVASALDTPQIDQARELGTAALFSREIDDDQVLTFYAEDNGTIRDEGTDSEWNAFGTAVDGPLAGTQLRQIPAGPHFWFAWVKFQPDTLLYGFD
ncbi:MAG: DUF3179 domain-containing protein [Chloroflexi bacterium]|nr:DUF3179 domain-containing protein [Chloroflexota bacterium]